MTSISPRPLLARSDTGMRRSWFPAVIVCAMVFASDLEYRQRNVTAALEGSADFAVVFELLVYFSIAGVLFVGAVAPRGRRLPPPLLIMWAYTLGLVISVAWAPSLTLSAVRGLQHLINAAMATVLARQADARDFSRLAGAYVLIMTAFIGLGFVWSVAPSRQVVNRFNWAATHPVVAAAFLVISVMILLGWTRKTVALAHSALRPSHCCCSSMSALVATQTCGAIFAAVVGAMVWLALAVRQRRQDLIVLTCLLVPVAVYVSFGIIESLIVRGGTIEQPELLNSRTTLWAEAISSVAQSPLVGRGYFASLQFFLERIGLGGAHNAYVDVLVSSGIIGVVLLTLLLGRMVRVLAAIRRMPQGPLIAALFASLLANGLTTQYWAQGWYRLKCVVLRGHCVGVSELVLADERAGNGRKRSERARFDRHRRECTAELTTDPDVGVISRGKERGRSLRSVGPGTSRP